MRLGRPAQHSHFHGNPNAPSRLLAKPQIYEFSFNALGDLWIAPPFALKHRATSRLGCDQISPIAEIYSRFLRSNSTRKICGFEKRRNGVDSTPNSRDSLLNTPIYTLVEFGVLSRLSLEFTKKATGPTGATPTPPWKCESTKSIIGQTPDLKISFSML